MSSERSAATGLSPNLDTEVGKLVIDTGLATQNELEFCREQQKQSSETPLSGQDGFWTDRAW